MINKKANNKKIDDFDDDDDFDSFLNNCGVDKTYSRSNHLNKPAFSAA